MSKLVTTGKLNRLWKNGVLGIKTTLENSISTERLRIDKIEANGVSGSAENISYDNSTSGLDADNIQTAMDKVNSNLGGLRFGTDGEGNYGYFGADDSLIPFKSGDSYSEEIEIVPLVPTLTSNIGSDGGEASISSSYGDTQAYGVFDGNNSTVWHSYAWTPQWVQYKFAKPTCVKNFRLVTSNLGGIKARLQASNDNSSWEDLSQLIDFPSTSCIYEADVNNEQYYLYYRLYAEESYYITASVPYVVISELQFYGYQMEALVPTMTSDTTPSGYIISASSTTTPTYQPYYIFDNDSTTHWYATHNTNQCVTVEFSTPVKVKAFKLTPFLVGQINCVKNYKIQVSNNNNEWLTIYTGVIGTSNASITVIENVDNDGSYKYYRIVVVDTHAASGYSTGITELQFYAEPEGATGGETKNSDIFISSIGARSNKNNCNGRTYVTFNTNNKYKLLTIDSITNQSNFLLKINGDGTTIFSTASAQAVSIDIEQYSAIAIYLEATEVSSGGTFLNNVCLKCNK